MNYYTIHLIYLCIIEHFISIPDNSELLWMTGPSGALTGSLQQYDTSQYWITVADRITDMVAISRDGWLDVYY